MKIETKKGWGIILSALLTLASASATEKYRVFKDTQGRTIEAVIVRFNESDHTVTIHPKGRSATTVPVKIFSAADQAYIIAWSHRQALMDKQLFIVDVSLIEQFGRGEISRDSLGEQRRYTCFYAFTIENKSTVDLEDLSIEYVIFYQQEKHADEAGWKKVNQQGTLHARSSVSIPHKSRKEFGTRPVRLTKYQVDQTGEYGKTARVDLDGKMDGIILRISMRTRDGETLTREIRYPEDLKEKWTTETRNAM